MEEDFGSSYKLSFRVSHPSFTVGEISEELGLEPKIFWNAGERARNKNNEQFGPVKKDTYCCYDIDYGNEVVGIKDEITEFLKQMDVNQRYLNHVSDTGGTLTLYLAWFVSNSHTGEVFTSTLIQHLSEFKINLAVEIYPDTSSL